MTPRGGRSGATPALVACVPGPAQALCLPCPPPRGPRPRRTAGSVTLAQPPPRSILRSRPQLASSSSSSSLSARPRKPDQGTRGFAGTRQGVQARARSGGAGSATRELLAPPSRRSRCRSRVSCHRRPVRRAGFVSAARGAGCQGTGGHAFPQGRGPLRGRLLSLRPVSALRAALRWPGRAAPKAAAWLCRCPRPEDQIGLGGARCKAEAHPPGEAAVPHGGRLGGGGFPEEILPPLACARERSGAPAPGRFFSWQNFSYYVGCNSPEPFPVLFCFECNDI